MRAVKLPERPTAASLVLRDFRLLYIVLLYVYGVKSTVVRYGIFLLFCKRPREEKKHHILKHELILASLRKIGISLVFQ